MYIKICLDTTGYNNKPTSEEVAKISKRVEKNEIENTLEDLAYQIGAVGYSWTPATFHNQRRKNENFKGQQLFALDFDGGVSLNNIIERAEKYRIPIAFIYETCHIENSV